MRRLNSDVFGVTLGTYALLQVSDIRYWLLQSKVTTY